MKRSSRKELFPSTSQEIGVNKVPSALPKHILEEIPQVPNFKVEVEVTATSLSVPPTLPPVQNTVSTQTPHLVRFFSSDEMLSDSK